MGVYNGVDYLNDSMQSVLAQEGVALELIVVDDGSTDETRTILASYAQRDPRVRILSQKRAGLTRALILGCASARGSYIARQDNGDLFLPGRLVSQVDAMAADAQLTFVSCWTECCGPKDEFLYHAKGSGRASKAMHIISEDAQHGVLDGPSHHASVMFRRDAYLQVGGYRPQFYFGQDWDLWYRLGEIGKFFMVGKVLHRARVMPNSLSGRYKSEQEMIAFCSHQALLRRLRGESEDDFLERAKDIRPAQTGEISNSMKARGLYFLGETLRRNGDARAEAYFREAIRECPTFLKSWVRLCQFSLFRR
jgi:glycosyltransferase involved in cell wall biosynthesis